MEADTKHDFYWLVETNLLSIHHPVYVHYICKLRSVKSNLDNGHVSRYSKLIQKSKHETTMENMKKLD